MKAASSCSQSFARESSAPSWNTLLLLWRLRWEVQQAGEGDGEWEAWSSLASKTPQGLVSPRRRWRCLAHILTETVLCCLDQLKVKRLPHPPPLPEKNIRSHFCSRSGCEQPWQTWLCPLGPSPACGTGTCESACLESPSTGSQRRHPLEGNLFQSKGGKNIRSLTRIKLGTVV